MLSTPSPKLLIKISKYPVISPIPSKMTEIINPTKYLLQKRKIDYHKFTYNYVFRYNYLNKDSAIQTFLHNYHSIYSVKHSFSWWYCRYCKSSMSHHFLRSCWVNPPEEYTRNHFFRVLQIFTSSVWCQGHWTVSSRGNQLYQQIDIQWAPRRTN